jgi:hypothetical protein
MRAEPVVACFSGTILLVSGKGLALLLEQAGFAIAGGADSNSAMPQSR